MEVDGDREKEERRDTTAVRSASDCSGDGTCAADGCGDGDGVVASACACSYASMILSMRSDGIVASVQSPLLSGSHNMLLLVAITIRVSGCPYSTERGIILIENIGSGGLHPVGNHGASRL